MFWDKMRRIQSKLHKIETYEVSKIFYSWFDDKSYLLDGDINSFAIFYNNILKNKSDQD